MDKLSRDVFGNISFTKQLKENKAFSGVRMKVYLSYNCIDYLRLRLFLKNFDIVEFKISLN